MGKSLEPPIKKNILCDLLSKKELDGSVTIIRAKWKCSSFWSSLCALRNNCPIVIHLFIICMNEVLLLKRSYVVACYIRVYTKTRVLTGSPWGPSGPTAPCGPGSPGSPYKDQVKTSREKYSKESRRRTNISLSI